MPAAALPRRTGVANLPLHRGKNSIPRPVDRKTYDRSFELLAKAINRTKLGIGEKREAVSRLGSLRR